jgi:hypothetical protein
MKRLLSDRFAFEFVWRPIALRLIVKPYRSPARFTSEPFKGVQQKEVESMTSRSFTGAEAWLRQDRFLARRPAEAGTSTNTAQTV